MAPSWLASCFRLSRRPASQWTSKNAMASTPRVSMSAPETPWLDLMVADLGTHEVAGPIANAVIVQRFADVGHGECQSDEIAWCAAETGSALVRSGYPLPPKDQRLLARSYCTYGAPSEPKRGAIVVWPRGSSAWQGHVGVVAGVDGEHVTYIAGNQSDQVGYGRGQVSDALA